MRGVRGQQRCQEFPGWPIQPAARGPALASSLFVRLLTPACSAPLVNAYKKEKGHRLPLSRLGSQLINQQPANNHSPPHSSDPTSPKSAGKSLAKPPRPAPASAAPFAKRPRTDGGSASLPTPLTPSLSDEDSGGAHNSDSPSGGLSGGASLRRGVSFADAPDSPAEEELDDEAIARKLHAALNCTPARSSRGRTPCATQAAPSRVHGLDPGLLPSC